MVLVPRLWRLANPGRLLCRSLCSSPMKVPAIAAGRGLVWSRPAVLSPLLESMQCRYAATKSCRNRPQKKERMKSYSSFKNRFKLMPDGTYARAHAGKNHNASSKTKKQRRQLRGADLVHSAYARVMRKLGFKEN